MVKCMSYYLAISSLCMPTIHASGALIKEKNTRVPFLCRAFEFPVAFLSLTKDVQREIVKKLPTPFKPVRPRLQEITHNQVNVKAVGANIEVNEESRLCAVFNEGSCFITSLDNPAADAEVHSFENYPKSMAFNASGTQLFLRFRNEAVLLTLDKGKIIEKRLCCQIDDSKNIRGNGKLQALPDGRFLIVDINKHIMVFDPSGDILTVINKPQDHDYTDHTKNPDYVSMSITQNGNPLVLYENCHDEGSLTPDVYDVITRNWSTLPLEITGDRQLKTRHCCYNSDRSLLATCANPRVRPSMVYIWNMVGTKPVPARSALIGFYKPCFKPNAPYLLVAERQIDANDAVRLYSLSDGAYIMAIPTDLASEFKFSTMGEYIVTCGFRGRFLLKWDPWWEELASFFNMPLLLEQYFFIIYLLQLGTCGLTLDTNGVSPMPHHVGRITQVVSPLTETDLGELKTAFLSLEPPLQKYLRIKYCLPGW